jgi:hypothetical protein
MTQPPGQWSEAAAPAQPPVPSGPPAYGRPPVPSGPPAYGQPVPSYYGPGQSAYGPGQSAYVPGQAPNGGGQPSPMPVAVPPPPPAAGRWQPERVEAVPGTEFGLVQLRIAPISSGPAIGSMIAGIASILVSLLVLCFGLAGSSDGWGALVAGAFAVLAVLAGGGAIAVGLTAIRQIRKSQEPGRIRFTGRGLGVAGIVCGSIGAGIALLSVVLSLVLQAS